LSGQEQRSAVSHAWGLGLAQVVGAGASALLLPVLTRVLGPDAYGQWSLVLVLISYVLPWTDLGVARGIIRFCPTYDTSDARLNVYRTVRRFAFMVSLSMGVLLAVLSPWLAQIAIGDAADWHLLCLIALLFPLEALFRVGTAFVQAEERLAHYARISTGRHVGELLLLTIAALLTADIAWLLLARIISLSVVVAWILYAGRRQLATQRSDWSLAPIRQFVGFGLPMIPAVFVWALIMSADRYMLKMWSSVSDVGLYNVADILALMLINWTRPINGVLQPKLANLRSTNVAESERYIRISFRWLAVLMAPCAVFLATMGRPVITLLSGAAFADAAHALPWLALGYVIIGLTNPLYHVVYLRRGGFAFLWLYGAALAVNIALNAVLIPQHGLSGAAFATMAAFLAYAVGLFALALPNEQRMIAAESMALVKIAGSAGVAALVMATASSHGHLAVIAGALAGGIIFFILMLVLRVIHRHEIRELLIPVRSWLRPRKGPEQ
jgi:O-antigen/teichoic acid export membrane protein